MDVPLITPQIKFLENLFMHQCTVRRVFRDVLGLHHIDYIAVSHVNAQYELSTFSSMPSVEYNLFDSNLWYFDKTYHTKWLNHRMMSSWSSLYMTAYYQDLYYLKQIKPHLPLGLSFCEKYENHYMICALASKNAEAQMSLPEYYDNFYRIGAYCYQHLSSLWEI